MPRISDYEVETPFNTLMDLLKNVQSRNTDEVNNALDDLINDIHTATRRIEIATHGWIIEKAEADIAHARECIQKLYETAKS